MTTERGGRQHTVAIGLSRFAGDRRRTLPFAAADARAFAAAMKTPDGSTLTDAEATTAAVTGAVGTLADAGPGDRIVLFVVTHAERTDDDIILATFDGGLSLRDLLNAVAGSQASRVVVLLDVQRAGQEGDLLTAAELAGLFPSGPGRTLVLADDGQNGSFLSGELQAGVWASQVTAAFAGAARSRQSDGALTAGTFREFLNDEVARSLDRAYTDGRRQSPVVLAASDDEILADPVAVESPEPAAASLAGVSFFTEREVPVKALGGFRKSLHTAPTDTLASSREWVARLAEPDLAREIEETVARLRQHLGYKRRDLRADVPQGGAASVLTPDFAYHVTVRQHALRPGQAVFRRTLDRIRKLDVPGRREFAEAFPQGFQSLRYPFETPVDLVTLIDAIEDAEPTTVRRIDYPTDLRHCDLELAGFEGTVRIEPGGVTITAVGPASPADLARQFALVRRVLATA